jgi:hypothetical protein
MSCRAGTVPSAASVELLFPRGAREKRRVRARTIFSGPYALAKKRASASDLAPAGRGGPLAERWRWGKVVRSAPSAADETARGAADRLASGLRRRNRDVPIEAHREYLP